MLSDNLKTASKSDNTMVWVTYFVLGGALDNALTRICANDDSESESKMYPDIARMLIKKGAKVNNDMLKIARDHNNEEISEIISEMLIK